MAKIIAIASQKGGVSKTTTSLGVSLALKQKGYKTLLVDTDPQCNSSDTYQAQTEGESTLYDILIEGDSTEESVQQTPIGEIIPCDKLLKDADSRLTQTGKEHLLRKALQSIKDKYDYIIIDTPPNLGVLLSNALTAANHVVITITADRYSLKSLVDLKETIDLIHEYTNPNLKISGLVFTKHNPRTRLSKEITETMPEIVQNLNTIVFQTCIRESQSARDAQARRISLYDYAPNSTTAKDYIDFTDELIKHLED